MQFMGNLHVKLYGIWISVQKQMSFKDIVYLELWRPLCSAGWNHLCNFGRRCHEELFCEIILNLGLRFRRCPLKTFLT